MLYLLLLLSFLSNVFGRIQVPFEGAPRESSIYFNLTIGTSGQTLRIEIDDMPSYPDLNVHDKRTFGFGFNPDLSSTFVKTADSFDFFIHDKDGISGTDDFNLNGLILKQKPFKVLTDFWDPDHKIDTLSINRYTNQNCYNKEKVKCVSFIESVLSDFDDQVVVLAFDNVTSAYQKLLTGQLILGEKPLDLCKSNWAFLPEVPNEDEVDQWTFNINGVSAGKYSYIGSTKTNINIGGSFLILPTQIYNNVLKSLGSVDLKTVPCNTKTDIIFDIGGKKVVFSSEMYIVRRNGGGNCHVMIDTVDVSQIFLPSIALSQKCVLYDFKNVQIGITDRV